MLYCVAEGASHWLEANLWFWLNESLMRSECELGDVERCGMNAFNSICYIALGVAFRVKYVGHMCLIARKLLLADQDNS